MRLLMYEKDGSQHQGSRSSIGSSQRRRAYSSSRAVPVVREAATCERF